MVISKLENPIPQTSGRQTVIHAMRFLPTFTSNDRMPWKIHISFPSRYKTGNLSLETGDGNRIDENWIPGWKCFTMREYETISRKSSFSAVSKPIFIKKKYSLCTRICSIFWNLLEIYKIRTLLHLSKLHCVVNVDNLFANIVENLSQHLAKSPDLVEFRSNICQMLAEFLLHAATFWQRAYLVCWQCVH